MTAEMNFVRNFQQELLKQFVFNMSPCVPRTSAPARIVLSAPNSLGLGNVQ